MLMAILIKLFNTHSSSVASITASAGGPLVTQSLFKAINYLRNYRPGVYYTLGFQFNLNAKAKK